jgi:acyl dehydratase
MMGDDREIVGRVFRHPQAVHVTEELIAKFCAVLGETDPLYLDAEAARRGPYGKIIAPPGFAATFRDGDFILDQLPRQSGQRRLAAGMDVEFLAPIRAGDSITVEAEIRETYEKTGRTGSMRFYVFRSTLRNQEGSAVAFIDHRFVLRD